MAKRKIAELTHTLPENGQYDIEETGISGKKYVGLPAYDYNSLAESLASGYDPVKYEPIIVETGTNRVLGGSHRVFCWTKEMNLDINDAYPENEQTEISVIEMSKAEFGKKLREDSLEPGDIALIPNRQPGWYPTKWMDDHAKAQV